MSAQEIQGMNWEVSKRRGKLPVYQDKRSDRGGPNAMDARRLGLYLLASSPRRNAKFTVSPSALTRHDCEYLANMMEGSLVKAGCCAAVGKDARAQA